MELIQEAEAYEAGFLQSGQVVGGEVAARWATQTAWEQEIIIIQKSFF